MSRETSVIFYMLLVFRRDDIVIWRNPTGVKI